MKPPKSVTDRDLAAITALRRKESTLRAMGNTAAANITLAELQQRERALDHLLSDEDRAGAEAFARDHQPPADFTPPG